MNGHSGEHSNVESGPSDRDPQPRGSHSKLLALAEPSQKETPVRRVAGVRLRRNDAVRWYDAQTISLGVGDFVVVQDDGGTNVGQVVVAPEQMVGDVPVADLPLIIDRVDRDSVERTPPRLELRDRVVAMANDLARARGLNVRVTRATVAADGSRVSLFGDGIDQLPVDVLATISAEVGAWVVPCADAARDRDR